tara:strand:- start:519 stop:899 length:381 start_codon:yes stop_codon:yes gene_type:complete
MKELNKKQIENVSGGILTAFELLHYLEECIKLNIFKPAALKRIKETIKHLIFIEENFYNQVEEMDEENISDKLMSNKLDYVKWMLNNYTHSQYAKLQEVNVAFSLDARRLCGISDKIHLENNAIKV